MPRSRNFPDPGKRKKRAAIRLRNVYAKVASTSYSDAWEQNEQMVARSFLLRIARAKRELEDALAILGYEIRPDESKVGFSIMKLRQ